ncbi:MAG: tRNA guanosine(34) transglycosylase Tgt [Armatimonadetes bacterium]|nr:tRNA guanosine(34) transglycosylase Tgt [Armatimonadota bacterium]
MRAGFSFEVLAVDSATSARVGLLRTPHGDVETPVFCPVGTAATVKSVSVDELEATGATLCLANTYHLMLRPGADRMERLGGLHQFMQWPRPLMTDSGGFQAFSLGLAREHGVSKIGGVFPEEPSQAKKSGPTARKGTDKGKLATVDDDGVTFRSFIDGSMHRLNPEISIGLQQKLGADLIVAFDECTSPLSDHEYTREAMERTHRWAVRSLQAHPPDRPQALMGIVQGGAYEDLRRASTRYIASLPFDAFCVGGSLGKNKSEMHQVLDWSVPDLPTDRFRHLLGIGDVDDMFESVQRGIDSFDCVLPTRFARHGNLLLTPPLGRPANRFRLNVWNARHAEDPSPVDPSCGCPLCTRYSRAYLRHLFQAQELLGIRLASVHNLWFMQDLMRKMRASIRTATFASLKAEWFEPEAHGRPRSGPQSDCGPA